MFPLSMFCISTLSLIILSKQRVNETKHNHVIKAIMFLLQVVSTLYLKTLISLL